MGVVRFLQLFLAVNIAVFACTKAMALSDSNIGDKLNKLEQKIKRRMNKKIKAAKALKHKREKKAQKLIQDSKGTWVNLWNYPKDLDSFFARQKKYDINTIYLQLNRSNTDIFKHPDKIDAFLETAHNNDIKVIGWSYCFLNDVESDIEKYVMPALYRTANGHSFDGMAADIEENINLSAVERYTEGVRQALPEDYPMLAIVFSPKIKSKYPWKYMGANWDVLMPMTYWHGLKNRTIYTVTNFVEETFEQLKELTGRKDLKIHLITDGDRTTANEVAESLRVAKELDIAAGVSIYPEHLASDQMLKVIKEH